MNEVKYKLQNRQHKFHRVVAFNQKIGRNTYQRVLGTKSNSMIRFVQKEEELVEIVKKFKFPKSG